MSLDSELRKKKNWLSSIDPQLLRVYIAQPKHRQSPNTFCLLLLFSLCLFLSFHQIWFYFLKSHLQHSFSRYVQQNSDPWCLYISIVWWNYSFCPPSFMKSRSRVFIVFALFKHVNVNPTCACCLSACLSRTEPPLKVLSNDFFPQFFPFGGGRGGGRGWRTTKPMATVKFCGFYKLTLILVQRFGTFLTVSKRFINLG